jgi:hypothetical protein
LILVKILIINDFTKKTRLRTKRTEPASALALNRFSQSNAQGYPQEWWITLTTPPRLGVTERALFAVSVRQDDFFSYFFTIISLWLCRLMLKSPIAKNGFISLLPSPDASCYNRRNSLHHKHSSQHWKSAKIVRVNFPLYFHLVRQARPGAKNR